MGGEFPGTVLVQPLNEKSYLNLSNSFQNHPCTIGLLQESVKIINVSIYSLMQRTLRPNMR
jgi:hypothetical protein